MSLKVRIKAHLQIAAVYTSPQTSGRVLEEELENLHKHNITDVIIAGDFNSIHMA